MSNIFNYDAPGAAKNYDKRRIALGVDVIAGMIHIYCGKPMKVPLSELQVDSVCFVSFFSIFFTFDEFLTYLVVSDICVLPCLC